MAKIIVSILFGITFIVALVVYSTRDQTSLEDRALEIDQTEPRVVVDDFAIYRYTDHRLTSTLSAKLAHFIEPNLVEIYASIRGVRYKEDSVESLRSEAASAIFDAENMSDLLSGEEQKLAQAEVEDQVRLGVGDNVLRTEHAQYFADEDKLFSREPVQIDGPNRVFVGEEGFEYHLTKETLSMNGAIKGVVKPNEIKK